MPKQNVFFFHHDIVTEFSQFINFHQRICEVYKVGSSLQTIFFNTWVLSLLS